MENFKRDGWSPLESIPENAWYRDAPPRPGAQRGSFGIFGHDFHHADAGDTYVTFLYHLKSGIRLQAFMHEDLAAEAAEIIEPLANWDQLLAHAKSPEEARKLANLAIGDRLGDFIEFEWSFDGAWVLTKVYRTGTAAPVSPERIDAN